MILNNSVTTFVKSDDGRKLSSRRVLFYLPDRFDGYNLGSRQVLQTPLPPVSVALCPTPRCVRNCTFCSNASRNKVNCAKSLSIGHGLFHDLVSDLDGLGTQGVSVAGGGEPLFYDGPLAAELFLRKKTSFKVGLHTNGVLLKKILSPEVFFSESFSYVNISVVAHTPELYQKVCRSPSWQFRQIEQAIADMIAMKKETNSKVLLGVKILLCRENYRHVVDIFSYYKNLGVENILLRCVGNFEVGQDVELRPNEIEWLSEVFERELGMSTDQIAAVTGVGPKKELPRPSRCWICALQYTAGVDPDGEVYLCSQWSRKDFSIGNINENSFADIWGSSRHSQVAEDLNKKLLTGQCNPLLCRHYYSNLAIDAFAEGLMPALPKAELEREYGRFI